MIISEFDWIYFENDKIGQKKLLDEVLPEYLHKCRWFAAKSTPIRSYTLANILTFEYAQSKAYFLVIEILLQSASVENYLLPILFINEHLPEYDIISNATFGNQSGILIDALYEESFRNQLYLNILSNTNSSCTEGYLSFKKGKSIPKSLSVSSHILKTEQSNTTIVYNDIYYLKLYRKLFRDANPDYELTEFLSEKMKFKYSPTFSGSITWKRHQIYDVSIGLMQEKIENSGDGWQFFTNLIHDFYGKLNQNNQSLKDYIKYPLYKPSEIQDIPIEYQNIIGVSVLEKIQKLGETTANMHISLFNDKQNRQFSPISFNEDYRVWMLNRILYMLDNRLNTLSHQYHNLKGLSKDYADYFLKRQEDIRNKILAFETHHLNSSRIRIHGDYHLGQILVQDDDFFILDFEGEPESTIRDRKVKQPALKDLAGLARSFHYAVYSCAFQRPDFEENKEMLFDAASKYYRIAMAILLGGYCKTAFDGGLNIGYYHEIDFILRYHIFEKAIYELGYELNSRPDWVIIPLKGIFQILEEND